MTLPPDRDPAADFAPLTDERIVGLDNPLSIARLGPGLKLAAVHHRGGLPIGHGGTRLFTSHGIRPSGAGPSTSP